MANNERKYINKLPDIIDSEFGKPYPIDMVREAYIHSDQGTKGFCKRYGLNEAQLLKYITAGNWELSKEQYRERMYKTFSKDRLEIVEWRQSLLNQMETLELIAVEGMLQDIARHFTEKGDLFVRNEEGEIMRDGYGNPLIKTIPKYLKEALEFNERMREQNIKVLVNANTIDTTSSKNEKIKEKSINLLDLANEDSSKDNDE